MGACSIKVVVSLVSLLLWKQQQLLTFSKSSSSRSTSKRLFFHEKLWMLLCSNQHHHHDHQYRVHGLRMETRKHSRRKHSRRPLLLLSNLKSNNAIMCLLLCTTMRDDILQGDKIYNLLPSATNDNEKNTDGNDSWSHWVSSPEKYAQALNMTLQQVQEVKEERKRAVQELQEQLSCIKKSTNSSSNSDSAAATAEAATVAAEQCHFLVCQHRFRYGKHPFVCPTCWSYQPICICHSKSPNQKVKLPLSCRQVIVWTHHEEWGSPSNTGSVLSIMLHHVELWMKGYHDLEMQQLLKNDTILPVLLWPSAPTLAPTGSDKDKNNNDMGTSSSSPINPRILTTKSQLQELVAGSTSSSSSGSGDKKKQIVLIAMEGTWRQARRLVAKFPKDIPRLSVTTAAITASSMVPINGKVQDLCHDKQNHLHSILYPLRRQRHLNDDPSDYSNNNMCTAEAVVAALQLLGMSTSESNQVLDAVRLKVDRTRRYQGKPLRSS